MQSPKLTKVQLDMLLALTEAEIASTESLIIQLEGSEGDPAPLLPTYNQLLKETKALKSTLETLIKESQ